MKVYKKDRKETMTNTRDVILKLKEVKKEKGLSLDKILILVENNGEYISKSTLARVFRDDSENCSFKYEETIRPIANALLDIETIEEDDDTETKAYKSLLKFKGELIAGLEEKLKDVQSEEKQKYQDKLQKEIDKFQRSLDFVKNQIELKDKRIDQLLNANDRLSITNDRLINQLMDCPLRNNCDEN